MVDSSAHTNANRLVSEYPADSNADYRLSSRALDSPKKTKNIQNLENTPTPKRKLKIDYDRFDEIINKSLTKKQKVV